MRLQNLIFLFPHREANLYDIQYLVKWDDNVALASHMKLFPNPRGLPILSTEILTWGINNQANTSYSEARDWGMKSFKKLDQVKSKAESYNFFREVNKVFRAFIHKGEGST